MKHSSLNFIQHSIRALVVFTILCGGVYPYSITIVSQILWPLEANGSLITESNQIIGSSLIGQNFTKPIYFSSRPSAVNFSTLPSGASNLGFTNYNLVSFAEKQVRIWGQQAPSDALTTSASGLDPHIYKKTALLQIENISRERHLDSKNLQILYNLVDEVTETSMFRANDEKYVNVLVLNQKLATRFDVGKN